MKGVDNYKTYIVSAVTVILVIIVVLLRNLPQALGYEPWISEEVFATLLTFILTGGGGGALMTMRHAIAKVQNKE